MNKIITTRIQVQFHSIQLRFIYVLKQQPFDQWMEEQEVTKIQIQYRKTFSRFKTKDGCTGNITHKAESAADWKLSPQLWGSMLDQDEQCLREKFCDSTQQYYNNNNNNNNKYRLYETRRERRGLLQTEVTYNNIMIIIFIYCNWVVTRWQWLFYMYTKYELFTTEFKSGGLHEKHVVATWNVGNHLSICL